MRYPNFIRPGDTIGFAAPSFGCNIEPYRSSFDHALSVFQKKGYRTLCGENVYAGDGIGISSSPERCGAEFTRMMLSDDCSALLSCGGGELMCEILDFVDFHALASAKPKWFMGYSDNTNLTFLLATLCDTASVYGPCAAAFGMEPWHISLHEAFSVLEGRIPVLKGYEAYEIASRKDVDHPLEPYACTEPRKIVCYDPLTERILLSGQRASPLSFSGRLIGGCLDILANLCGTQFDRTTDFLERYADDGFIWFLEACDLNVFSIRRAVWEFQHAGWFRHVKGFLFGRTLAAQQKLMGLDHIHAVTDLLSCYHVPILLDVDIGHLPPMMPLITGSIAYVDFSPKDGSMDLYYELKA